jgi:hypothetical protein
LDVTANISAINTKIVTNSRFIIQASFLLTGTMQYSCNFVGIQPVNR